ncbi:MAG: 3-phosphoshikimate 1-carboxyvinyltransferase [Hydrogenophilus sp.]|nr:3-phosphoshikimate 1-carboxyvinyltransferase [Hydrogenophilus sp.]
MRNEPEGRGFLDLLPAQAAEGVIRLPGSKSISNRVMLLAALAEGRTVLHNVLSADDTMRMREALSVLGIEVQRVAEGVWTVTGCGGRVPVREGELFLGNAGTAFRPLTAVLALAEGNYRLRGVPRMHERPIGDLVEALRQWGAQITYLEQEGYPPLAIAPAERPLGEELQTRVRGSVSSQFVSALLIAAPLTGRRVVVEVEGALISQPYVAMTVALMEHFGVNVTVEEEGRRFVIPEGSRYRSPEVWYVEGDASAASYFWAMGAVGGGPVRVEGVGRASIQGDVAFAELLAAMGAAVEWEPQAVEVRALPAVEKAIREGKWPDGPRLHGLDCDATTIPDAAMTLAVLALFADRPMRLSGVGSWRVKETDRIAAMTQELSRVGAEVESGEDWLVVHPPRRWRPAVVRTYDDHRVAMAMALAAFGGVALRLLDPGCVAKTFPTYWEWWERLVRPMPVVTVDGLSASGKGTVAKEVAASLGWHYLDSGALYRAVAWQALARGIPLDDARALSTLAESLTVEFVDGRVHINGTEAEQAIRADAVGEAASQIAQWPEVRAALLWQQRAMARSPGLVADGRDMGSVVFPEACAKLFLTASVEVRARRRYKQLIENGMHANIAELQQTLTARDLRDQRRATAPLQPAADAKVLDTSDWTVEETVQQALDWVRDRCTGRARSNQKPNRV